MSGMACRLPKITNISGTSDMTRSGCIFALPELLARSKEKGKAKADIGEREKTGRPRMTRPLLEKLQRKEMTLARERYRMRR